MSSDSISSSARLRTLLSVRWNWVGVVLVGVTLAVQGGALWLTHAMDVAATVAPDVSQPTQASNPTLSLRLVALLVVEVLVLVGLYRLYSRLSERVRRAIKYGVVGALLVGVTYLEATAGNWRTVGVLYAAIGAILVSAKFDVYWLVFDALAITIGIIAAAVLGHQLGPAVVLPMLVLLLLYDFVAVDLSDIMGDLIKFSNGAGLPNFIVVPSRARVDFERLREYLAGGLDDDDREKPADVATVIGVGDFMFPALLTVSASVAVDGALVPATAFGSLLGACLAVGVLQAALHRRDGGVPALPWLNTGAILGFALGAVVLVAGGVPVGEVFGL